MDSKYILENFRLQVLKDIEKKVKIRNAICLLITLFLFIGFVYIVTKQVSISKYFFL
jgi:hypothetical protein